MTRRPRRNLQRGTSRPLTFSPFSRSLALISSAHSRKDMHKPDVLNDIPSTSEGNGNSKINLKETDSDSTTSDEEEFDGVVQADFAFFDPKPGDFHGVKTLLQNYLDDKEWDLSGLVDLILEQTTVGTVVKIEDAEDDGIFSVVSALNLGRYKNHKCIAEVKEYLLMACKEKDVKNELKSLLGEKAHNVGLLISQHVTNFPPQLLPPLYDGLFDEVSWATEDEPTEKLQNSFKFQTYLFLTKFYKRKSDPTKSKSKKNHNDGDDILYTKPEDEIFHKLSSWSFSFSLHKQVIRADELKDYQPMGLVMAVGADKVPTFRSELKSLIDES